MIDKRQEPYHVVGVPAPESIIRTDGGDVVGSDKLAGDKIGGDKIIYQTIRAQEAPILNLKGKTSPKLIPRDQRWFYAFGFVFVIFWCMALLFGFFSSVMSVPGLLAPTSFLMLSPFILVVLWMYQQGVGILLGHFGLYKSEVTLFASSDIVIISYAISLMSFSLSFLFPRNDFRFEDNCIFVKSTGRKVDLPPLPEHIERELQKYLSRYWPNWDSSLPADMKE